MNYEVKQISYKEAKPFVLHLHYAKRMPSISYAYGLFEHGLIKGVCTFGTPASNSLCVGICGEQNKKNVLELNRLILLNNLPKNTASYFISKCIKKLPPKKILVSYADTSMNHVGYVYQATNWLYTGATKPRTDMYAGEGKHSRHHKGDKKIRVFRSSKHRYVYFHKCSRDIKNSLNYKIQEYPKGDISYYDINTEDILRSEVNGMFLMWS